MSSSRRGAPAEPRVVRPAAATVLEFAQVSELPTGRMGQPIPFEVARSMQRGYNHGYEEGYGQGYTEGVRQGSREAAEAARALDAELARRSAELQAEADRLTQVIEAELAERRAELAREADRVAKEQAARVRQALGALESARTSLEAAAADLARRDALVLDDVQSQVVDLSFAVAEALVQHELRASADPGRDALLRALALVPDRGDAVARLNPLDLAAVADVSELLPGRELALVADPEVERGGCVVEIGPARVDAQLAPALERVREALGAARIAPATTLVPDGAAVAAAARPEVGRARRPASSRPAATGARA